MPPKNLPIEESAPFADQPLPESPPDPEEISAPKRSRPSRNVSPDRWSPLKAILAIVIFLVFVWILWYIFSDSDEVEEVGEAAKAALEDIGTTSARTAVPVTPAELKPSLYAGWVNMSPGTAAKEVYPEKEYVVLDVTQKNLSGIDISGWTLRNSSGESALFGSGLARGGDRIYVSSGASPTGASFRINKCSGYLEQHLDFVPPITLRCPRPSSEKAYAKLETSCRNFIRTFKICETNTKEFPADASSACRAYVNTNINYNTCFSLHKNDNDFYANEWRIYLNQGRELWAEKGEMIMLLDAEGNLVASVQY